jgi:N-acetylmuramoyl-L-alanine amidase
MSKMSTDGAAAGRIRARGPARPSLARFVASVALVCLAVGTPLRATPEQQRDLFARTLARERVLRDGNPPPTVQQIREVVGAYERFVRRFPISGYSDNALWQAGNLSLLAYQRFRQTADRRAGLRLLNQLKSSYPSSSLLERYDETVAEFDAQSDDDAPVTVASRPAPPVAPAVPSAASPPVRSNVESPPGSSSVKAVASTGETVAIRSITRTALADGVRVSIEMDGEISYHQERLDNPRRVFFDLKGARPIEKLLDATLKFPDDPVPEIRLGRHPQNTTRVVMDMRGADDYSVFTLYNPYRVVVDFHRSGAPVAAVPRLPVASPVSLRPGSLGSESKATAGLVIPSPVVPPAPIAAAPIEKIPLPSRAAVPPALAAPSVPAANSNGRFSIARQLGLGVSRIVIDAGHGGHDPGAHGNGINEADLVLDVALRLRRLLTEQAGVDVVMTRDTDVFIPLEERTSIANRESADLFLSIHANASRNTKVSGIETYFLNFASNPEAAAVAARENTTSGKTMHSLPEIVRAITLNNKIDESRDFAELVQKAMVKKLAVKNAELKDLGVKQAPFVVLIGAGMPSVLAEISFVTHRQEGQLLKTPAYREQIAEALFDAVQGYQKSLKSRSAVASSTREE